MSQGHTPQPWDFSHPVMRPAEDRTGVCAYKPVFHHYAGGGTALVMQIHGHNDAEIEANAALIEAALKGYVS